ncbi:MAG: Alpha/beta hydrolase fold-3 domain protein [Ignavibacteria bacterium]|nr:MAG: Alpha/beta hydrolase fold-3 domain protein [Ignavibacteria bacterium]KAF0160509.1 MAG: Alpha/beta hydrolase fold-3 domain protein [Ignavibacteria bacterium]
MNSKPLISAIILAMFVCSNLLAQEIKIPRDTSFNTKSTAEKILKDYPFAIVVEAIVTNNVKAEYGVVYTTRGKRKLHLDIVSPKIKGRDKFPFVMVLHGGGWRSGNKEMELPTAVHLANNGYAAASVEYRLSGEAKYPAAIYDLKEALRWIKKNAEKHNIDTNKIAVSGVSAGGTLAAFLGATGNLKKFEGDGFCKEYSTHVHAIVNIDGIVDFTHPAESGKDTDPAKPSAGKAWFGAAYKENPQIWEVASPIKYVSEKTPPIIFINSSQERFRAGRNEMIDKMNKYNTYSEVHSIANTPHPFWLFQPWFDETMKYMVSFLNKVLDVKKELNLTKP